MEKLSMSMFDSQKITQLSSIFGGVRSYTECTSSTCNDYTGKSDTREIRTGDDGVVTSDKTWDNPS